MKILKSLFFILCIFITFTVTSCETNDDLQGSLLLLLSNTVINPEKPNTITFSVDGEPSVQWSSIQNMDNTDRNVYYFGPGQYQDFSVNLPDGTTGTYHNDNSDLFFDYSPTASDDYVNSDSYSFSITVTQWDGPGGICAADFSGSLLEISSTDKTVYIEGTLRANIQ